MKFIKLILEDFLLKNLKYKFYSINSINLLLLVIFLIINLNY